MKSKHTHTHTKQAFTINHTVTINYLELLKTPGIQRHSQARYYKGLEVISQEPVKGPLFLGM